MSFNFGDGREWPIARKNIGLFPNILNAQNICAKGKHAVDPA